MDIWKFLSNDLKKLFNSDYNIIQKEIQNLSEASKKTSNEIMKEIPDKYMNLLELEIFNNDLTLNSDSLKELWNEFAKWLFFLLVKILEKNFVLIVIIYSLKY